MKNGKASRAFDYLDEKLIASAMDESDLGGKCPKKGGTMMKFTAWKKWGALAAALVLVLTAVLVTAGLFGGADAVVALDVNPSLTLSIDKREKVTAVTAANPEAEALIASLTLVGRDLDDALDEILDVLVENRYLTADQNSVLLSVGSESNRQEKSLKSKLAKAINTALETRSIHAAVLTQSYDPNGDPSGRAEQYRISVAKAALIEKIVTTGLLDANGTPYRYETLAKLRVHELKQILDSKAQAIGGLASTGTAGTAEYLTAEQALTLALNKAGLGKDDVTKIRQQLDFDDDIFAMVYEIEFRHGGMEYEYELSAKTGDVLEEEREPVEEDDDETPIRSDGLITREQALAAAYAAAGITADEARRPKIELDLERGVYVYEIEFKVGLVEYEYTLNAETGAVIHRDAELFD